MKDLKNNFIKLISSPQPKLLLGVLVIFLIFFLYGISQDTDLINAYSEVKGNIFKMKEDTEDKPTISNKRIIYIPSIEKTITRSSIIKRNGFSTIPLYEKNTI